MTTPVTDLEMQGRTRNTRNKRKTRKESNLFRDFRLFRVFRVLPCILIFALGCGSGSATRAVRSEPPPAAPIDADREMSEATIRFLEDRLKADPDDFIARNKLGGYYLARLRETGQLDYLRLAERTAAESLRAIPAEQNTGGLALMAQAAFAAHDFASARRHAEQLTKLEPRKSYPYQLLADALIELGEYDAAIKVTGEMERREGMNYGSALRLARLASLRGETARARELYTTALALALEVTPPSRESVAWCRWQLGEIEFNTGNYETAERHYRDSLTTFPGYYRGLAGMGRVRAARGDIAGAIDEYEKAVRLVPEPVFVAALGDLYELAGRVRESQTQFELIDQMARLGKASGSVYNRQLALFDADHDRNAEAAYELAKSEYESRRDIYGADALAWTALKAGKIDVAKQAIGEALRLGTEDARLFYHAGMIAHAAGDRAGAKRYLERALKLSPQFDPRQARVARQTLDLLTKDGEMK